MAEPKTTPNDRSVDDFIARITDPQKKEDTLFLAGLLREITGEPPVMWGDSIIGYGTYHYVYSSGREGDWMLTGFSPRKKQMTVYVMNGFSRYEKQLARLGKHKHSVSCLYFNRLSDINIDVLRDILEDSVRYMRTKYN